MRDRGTENFRPEHAHQFALYLGGRWYSLDARPGTFDPEDPIGVLDVDISSRLILDKQLGITASVPPSASISSAVCVGSTNCGDVSTAARCKLPWRSIPSRWNK